MAFGMLLCEKQEEGFKKALVELEGKRKVQPELDRWIETKTRMDSEDGGASNPGHYQNVKDRIGELKAKIGDVPVPTPEGWILKEKKALAAKQERTWDDYAKEAAFIFRDAGQPVPRPR